MSPQDMDSLAQHGVTANTTLTGTEEALDGMAHPEMDSREPRDERTLRDLLIVEEYDAYPPHHVA